MKDLIEKYMGGATSTREARRRTAIAKKVLRASGDDSSEMSKEEARRFLKGEMYTDKEIKKISKGKIV